MFKKIDVTFNEGDFTKKDAEIIKYGEEVDGEFRGISYNQCELSQEFAAKLLGIVPPNMIHHFTPMVMEINREIPPHVDSGINTVINFYVKAGGYVTDFNKPKDGAEAFKLDNQTNGYIIDFDQVDVVDSFTAEDGDAYILDVTKLHSVHSGVGDRTAIAISTQLSFDEVCALL